MALFLIPTPIGNLEDMTLRAVKILKEVDFILTEDTRRTGKLLAAYQISKKMLSYHDFNERKMTSQIIPMLKEGKNIALVSDAGTPLISDPGFFLVRECVREGIEVVSIPGASAAVVALVGSGCACDKFTFLGFLPKKDKARQDILDKVAKEYKMTFIFYESPYRVSKTIEAMAKAFPERKICVARELTKKFEEFLRGTAAEVFEKVKGKEIKGEIVIVVDKFDAGDVLMGSKGTISIDEAMRRHKERWKEK